MKATNIPSRVPLPFANSGAKNSIPTASQIGITPGAASLTDGFPPLTRTPLSAGGVPPNGKDFNGIFNIVTAVQQWQSAGGFFTFDSTFSTSVNGYPKGAVLANTAGTGLWLSLVDDNTVDPDANPNSSNWASLNPGGDQTQTFLAANATPGTQQVTPIGQADGRYMQQLTNTLGSNVDLNTITTPGSYFLNGVSTNSPTPSAVFGALLVFGQITETDGLTQIYYNNSGAGIWTRSYNGSSSAWTHWLRLPIFNIDGTLSVARATSAGEAVSLGQSDDRYALSGADGSNVLVSLANGITFTQSDSGKLFSIDALIAGNTLTLPNSGLKSGWHVRIAVGANVSPVYVKAATGASTPSIIFPDGSSVATGVSWNAPPNRFSTFDIVWDGTDYRLSPTGGSLIVSDAVNSNEALALGQVPGRFPSSLGIAGWKKYPDPNSPSGYFIEQWSRVTSASTPKTFNYPVAFPNGVTSVSAIAVNTNVGYFVELDSEPTLSSLQFSSWADSGARVANIPVFLTVKGY